MRHALRARGVVLISGWSTPTAFDLYTDRKLRYSRKEWDKDPKKKQLKKDQAALTKMAKDTLNSWYGRKVSPVFALLEEQRETPWRKLLLAGHNEYGEAYKRWARAVDIARRKSRPGDILVLADETPNRALWLEAKCTAGDCLMELQQYEFALKQFDEALEEDPENLVARQRRTICLGRVGRYPEARDVAHDLIRELPNDAENWIRLGRVEKDNWMSLWWWRCDCDLRFEDVSDSKPKDEIIRQLKMEFDSKKKECAVLIVRAASHLDKWTLAGFNDVGEFRTIEIDDPSPLSEELKRKPVNKRRIAELATSSLGRTCKGNVTRTKELDDNVREKMQENAAAEDASLQEAINAYKEGFLRDPTSCYAGTNAVTLCHLQRHLAEQPSDPDMKNLEGAVFWACRSALKKDPKDFWARASVAQLSLHGESCDADAVSKEYRYAVAAADNSSFALDSTRQTLYMLWNLGYRREEVEVALRVMKEEQTWKPRRVLLFSGHMIDAPDRRRRSKPRFPAEKTDVAVKKIEEALDQQGAGPDDLALAQAASGGDLLFLEACQQRGVRCQILLPFEEPEFIQRSILPSEGGDTWRDHYYVLKDGLKNDALHDALRIMPVELGRCPKNCNPFERCNLWLLYTALAWGVDKVRFLCLWNGDGGITAHMMSEVKKYTGRIRWLNTRELW